MAQAPEVGRSAKGSSGQRESHASVSSGTEQLLLEALERGGESLETGRFLISYREGMVEEGIQRLKAENFRLADARDFPAQAVRLEDAGDAEVVVFPELGVALVGGDALQLHGMSRYDEIPADSPIQIIEPEYFAFSESSGSAGSAEGAGSAEYLRGFVRAATTIAQDLGGSKEDLEADVPGATWGLIRCRVPQSCWTGSGIRVAVLDTGMDPGHPDFAGRQFDFRSFVGEPVQDLNGHGTHCVGTACGPQTPPGSTPRYGVASDSQIFVGKVLTDSGGGTGAGVLSGMNWAIANRCEIISMSLGSQGPVQESYTHAGAAALRKGCLIIAAAGNNASSNTGAPANSPTIMSVASLDPDMGPSRFSNFGKIEIAAPGRDVFSSWPRPTRYRTLSGTSMATPHVAGCAALWAQSSSSLRGMDLWKRLQASAKRLPFPVRRVGEGAVQAP